MSPTVEIKGAPARVPFREITICFELLLFVSVVAAVLLKVMSWISVLPGVVAVKGEEDPRTSTAPVEAITALSDIPGSAPPDQFDAVAQAGAAPLSVSWVALAEVAPIAKKTAKAGRGEAMFFIV
jgi:hypothetical protein